MRTDLVAIDIRRGRDHGLPAFNAARVAVGLQPLANFSQLTADTNVSKLLDELYGHPDQCDLYVCGMLEKHAAADPHTFRTDRAVVGETFKAIITRQFANTRNGDRFWYQGGATPLKRH